MREKLKRYSLGLCLFVFLFVVIGGGFHPTRAERSLLPCLALRS
jgi:hypothetical protein